MLYTTAALSDHGVNYWLDYGSLLGAWRDHGIVPWEFDVVRPQRFQQLPLL